MCKCLLITVTSCVGRARASPVKSGVDPKATDPWHGHTPNGAAGKGRAAFSFLGEFLRRQGHLAIFHQGSGWVDLGSVLGMAADSSQSRRGAAGRGPLGSVDVKSLDAVVSVAAVNER